MATIMVNGVYIRICNVPEKIPTDYWRPVAKKCNTRDLITRSSMGEENDYYVEMTAPESEKTESIVTELLAACAQVGIEVTNKDNISYLCMSSRELAQREQIIITIEFGRENKKNRGEMGSVVSDTLEKYLDRLSYQVHQEGRLPAEEVVTPAGVYISMIHGVKRNPYKLPLDEPRYLMPNGRYITGRLSGY
ncbi:TPA: hypothetical protein ACIBS5_002869 [Salmonella enterica subsp. diarizonae serovar 60-67:z35:-]